MTQRRVSFLKSGYARAMTDTNPFPRTPGNSRRISTETKSAVRTTELIVYVIAVAGVLIASAVVSGQSSSPGHPGHPDYFKALDAWRLITILTVGYMISRGLAKSGSRDFYDDHDHDRTHSAL